MSSIREFGFTNPILADQRHPSKDDADEQRLTADIIALAKDHGRYGYRRIEATEAVSVLAGDGWCIRLRPQHRGHVWSYELGALRLPFFASLRIRPGSDAQRPQTPAAEHHRRVQPAWLAMVPLRRFRSNDVLVDLFIENGPPEHIRSDNGPDFVANAVRERLGRLGVTILHRTRQLAELIPMPVPPLPA